MFKELVIVGGGPAGNAAALAAVDAGSSSVLLVERDAMGGTCTNRGCIPTKFLLSRSVSFLTDGTSGPSSGSWERIVGQKTALVKGLARSIESRCTSRGIQILHGSARFISPNEVEVTASSGEITRVEGKTFILATGSEPAQLPFAPADGTQVITSNEALELKRLPRSVVIIGSGAVGSEFAFIFRRVGVAVHLVEAAERLFPQEDPDVDPVFRRVYERLGIGLRVGSPVVAIQRRQGSVAVQLRSGEVLESEVALVGVGRSLCSRGLGLEAAGVATGPRGDVTVDERLYTSSPHILAAGDVTGRMLLAHAAAFMGEQAARLACGQDPRAVPFQSIPWATYTSPEIGAVGLTVAAAERAGVRAVAASAPLMDSVKARIDRQTEGFVKLVVEKGTGRILGGTIVGPHASDLIHVVALAVHKGMTASEVRGFSFAHPSLAELIGDLLAGISY